MPKQVWADCHSHSNCSPDGNDSVIDMCKRAVDLGLTYYSITDHCECNDFNGKSKGFSYEESIPKAFAEVTKASQEFKGKLNVLKGVELGQPLQNIKAAETVLKNNYDFVLGSVHNITGCEDFYFLDYNDITKEYLDNMIDSYLSEVLETARWGKVDSLSHLTYPLRYIPKDKKKLLDFNSHPLINEIFSVVIENNIAIEVNASGVKKEMGVTLPDVSLLKKYREMGGELATIGSDAHRTEDIGVDLDAALGNLYKAGFREYTVFVERKPVMIPIESVN